MFCNTCILFFELFMCKVLGLGFFYYKILIFKKIFFGLGPKLEIDQAFQPSTPPCPPNMARRWLGWNGNVKLALALSQIMPNGCWPNIWKRCMA